MITAKDVAWETSGPEEPTTGSVEIDGIEYEIEIEGRERPSMWNRSPSNVRHWTFGEYATTPISDGTADGLRNAKRDALVALNTHLTRT